MRWPTAWPGWCGSAWPSDRPHCSTHCELPTSGPLLRGFARGYFAMSRGLLGGLWSEWACVGIGAELTSTIPGVDADTAQALVDAAHEACPYSKATRGNIDVT